MRTRYPAPVTSAPRFAFPATLRVLRGRDFRRAYNLRRRCDLGCMIVYAAPNGTPLPRLGLSVSRRVGPAVQRNRFKRLLREAFRLEQANLPPGVDFVVVVRPHRERQLDDYRALLLRCVRQLEDAEPNPRTGS